MFIIESSEDTESVEGYFTFFHNKIEVTLDIDFCGLYLFIINISLLAYLKNKFLMAAWFSIP